MKTYLPHLKASAVMTLFLCFATPLWLIAQTDTTKAALSRNESGGESYRKNMVKVNLASLYFNNYNFTYERMLARKTSFAFSYRTMPKSKLGSIPIVKKILSRLNDQGISNDVNDISVSDKALTGEFRFYAGRHAGARGIYLSLYGRYATFDIDYNYRYQTSNKSYQIPISTKANGIGAGLMVGKQFEISKRVVLDVFFVGAHYGTLNGKSSGKADLSALTSQQKIDIQNDVESKAQIGNKRYLNAMVSDQGITGKIHGPFAGIRALGFTLGISF